MQESKRQPKSFRLSAEGRRLLVELAAHLGVSQNDVVELAIREVAVREGLIQSPRQYKRRASETRGA